MNGAVRTNRGGNLIKGFLIFLVAFMLGIAVTLAGIVGGIYAALAFVTIDTLEGLGIDFADSFLEEDSELRGLSVLGMVGEVLAISGQLSDTTFNSLMAQYGVIVSDDVRKYIPDGLVDLPFSEFVGDNAAHVLLSHVTFGDVFEISGEFVPEALALKISPRTLDLAVEQKFDQLLEGVYLGDIINVALEVREDGLAYPIVEEGERPRVVDHFATLDLGEFFAAEDREAKDAVLNKTLARVPLTDMMADEDGVFGDSISDKSLGDLLIIKDMSFLFSMEPLLEDLYLGHVLGYHQVYEEDGVTLAYWADKNEKPAKGLYHALVDISINDLGDTDIMERIDSVYVAELMDYERVEDGVDEGTGEPIYRFYKYDANGDRMYDADGNPIEPSGMTKDLAVLTVGELRNEGTLNEEIRAMQIGTVMGYTEDANGIWRNEAGDAAQGVMRPLLGSTVGFIDEDMDKLYLGQVMGFDILKNENGDLLDQDGTVIEKDEDGNLKADPGFYKDLNHNGLYDKKENDDDTEFDTEPGALMAAFVGMKLSDIDNEDKFTERVNNVRVGDAMGYVEEDGVWYEKGANGDKGSRVEGMFQTLASSKVNELEGAVQKLTLADALGYKEVGGKWIKDGEEATGIFRILMEKESNLTNLSEKAGEVYLGEIMGYTKTEDTDEDGNPIFKKDGTPASGVIASFVGLTVEQLESDDAIKSKIDNMAVGTAMGYKYDEDNKYWYSVGENNEKVPVSGFMELIDPDTKISELGSTVTKIEEKPIKDFVDAKILDMDQDTIDSLDKFEGFGDKWEESTTLDQFVGKLIDLVDYLNEMIPGA